MVTAALTLFLVGIVRFLREASNFPNIMVLKLNLSFPFIHADGSADAQAKSHCDAVMAEIDQINRLYACYESISREHSRIKDVFHISVVIIVDWVRDDRNRILSNVI